MKTRTLLLASILTTLLQAQTLVTVSNPDPASGPIHSLKASSRHAGNLAPETFSTDRKRFTLDFESAVFGINGSRIALVRFDGSKGKSKSQTATPEKSLRIRFSAPNDNWWRITPTPQSVGKKGIDLRGIPAKPEELFMTFSRPLTRLSFTLQGLRNDVTVIFFRDPEGTVEIHREKLLGKDDPIENGKPVGSDFFVGLENETGISKIAFSFPTNNIDASSPRILDDLSFVLADKDLAPSSSANDAYPPEVLSFSYDDKESQKEAAVQLKSDVAKAAEEGAKVFRIPPGHYRFEAARGSFAWTITATNLVVDGTGSTFWFDGRAAPTCVSIRSSKNLTLRGMTIDFDPLPFTQGEITEIDREGKSLILKLDSGFPEPDRTTWFTRGGLVKMLFFGADGILRPSTLDWMKTMEEITPRTYRVSTANGDLFKHETDVAVGDRLVLPPRFGGHTIESAWRSEAIVLEDLTIHGSPHMGFTENNSIGGNRYTRIRVVRRPATKRLLACNADIFHSIKVEKGPLIEHCELSFAGDDAINIHGFYSLIMEQLGPRELRIADHFSQELQPGMTLRFLEYETMKLLGEGKILSLVIETNQLEIVREANRLPADLRAMGKRATEFHPRNIYPTRVWLDRDVHVKRFDLVENYSAAAIGTVIRSNHIHDTIARGILLKSSDGLIEGNRIERTHMNGVLIANDIYFWESPTPRNIVIRQNQVVDCARGYWSRLWPNVFSAAVSVAVEGHQNLPSPGLRSITGLRIESNLIKNSGATALLLGNLQGGIVSGNVIDSPWHYPLLTGADPKLKERIFGIYLTESSGTEIKGNRFINLGKAVQKETGYGKMD